MITLEYLELLKPGTIFKSGYFTKEGVKFRWVAARGDVYEWSVYFHVKGRPDNWIVAWGNKITNKVTVRELVPCDDEVFKMYRY